MAESDIHMKFVQLIADYIGTTFPQCNRTLLDISLPDSVSQPSKVINGYIPDVWYSDCKSCVIGEAKTFSDVENKHTKNQIDSYIKELLLHQGAEKHLVLCTSIYRLTTLQRIATDIRSALGASEVKIHTIDDLQRSFVV